MEVGFPVAVAAGCLGPTVRGDATFSHRWTAGGVAVETEFTGAHLLHLATAACVLNDLYREAASRGLRLDGVRVDASGGFDTAAWTSRGIRYRVQIQSSAAEQEVAELIAVVEQLAEIPRVLRAGAEVQRVE